MISEVPVLIVEDDPRWQAGIQILLNQISGFQVISTVDNYEDALTAFEEHQPQLVLLDWQISGEKDGLDIGYQLMRQGLSTHQIILISAASQSSIPKHPFLYIPKNQLAEQLLPLLTSIFSV